MTTSAGVLAIDYSQLDASYLSNRLAFVAEGTTPDLTLQKVQASFQNGAWLVAIYQGS
ncbi:hypothetical protein [Chromobacterium amazonense]|uniref:hypothetical protein n=1 Tax=Chromobacterium amazonense TaxID=1382803 RepID=UPI003F7A1426